MIKKKKAIHQKKKKKLIKERKNNNKRKRKPCAGSGKTFEMGNVDFVWKGFDCCWCGEVASGSGDGCDSSACVEDRVSPLLEIGVGRWFPSRTGRKQKAKEEMKERRRLGKKKAVKKMFRKRKKERKEELKV
jgi:hypothetical protein